MTGQGIIRDKKCPRASDSNIVSQFFDFSSPFCPSFVPFLSPVCTVENCSRTGFPLRADCQVSPCQQRFAPAPPLISSSFPSFFSRKRRGLGQRPKKYNPYINPMIRQNSGFVARLPAFFDRCLTACRMPGGIRRNFRLPPPRQPLKRLRSRRYALHVRASRRHFFE